MQSTWFQDWLTALWRWWWVLLIGIAGGVIPAIGTSIAFGWPWYAWASVVLVGLVVASMLAYRQVWIERAAVVAAREKLEKDLEKAREDLKAEKRPTFTAVDWGTRNTGNQMFDTEIHMPQSERQPDDKEKG